MLSYDNISSIPKAISDALCQVTSGTGFRKRRLYSDLDLVLVGGYRTVIITGVHNAVTEPEPCRARSGIVLAKTIPTLRKVGVEVTKDRATIRTQRRCSISRRIEQKEQPQQ